jgi:hypothetical protein
LNVTDQSRLTRVEMGESVAAVHAHDVGEMPEALFVRVGAMHLVGRPAAVIDALSRALHQCYSAHAAGSQVEACDGPGVHPPRRQANSLPLVTETREVDEPLSRIAPWATAKLLVLDGGAAISQAVSAGGGIKTSFYLIRHEDGA